MKKKMYQTSISISAIKDLLKDAETKEERKRILNNLERRKKNQLEKLCADHWMTYDEWKKAHVIADVVGQSVVFSVEVKQ